MAGAPPGLRSAPPDRWLRCAIGHVIVLLGLSALVAAVWAGVVLALGRPPVGDEWGLLGLCAVGAAACALLWVPLRRRVATAAARLVHADRAAPEDALRAFGSRLTRSLPLDELLLQLAESLRRTLALDAAEVWTGPEGVLELAASDPHRDGGTLILSPAEQSVVARAGVSGPGWRACGCRSSRASAGRAASTSRRSRMPADCSD